MDDGSFSEWFASLSDGLRSHPWQSELAREQRCGDRLIRVPTGLGKTLGVLTTWLYHRVHRGDDAWPRRLVWCLPMRVLVEQTQAEAERILAGRELLWDRGGDHAGRVGVHLLMGGSDAGEWHLWPEECAVLIGTQDMLLSRALNRGYGAPRARWPMELGLLNHDSLWVMDEVQLMDVGLATSSQLQAFRAQDIHKSLRPCVTWWMSATLQRGWLRSVDTGDLVDAVPELTIPEQERRGSLWQVTKALRTEPLGDEAAIADRVLDLHQHAQSGAHGRVTLVVLNTVDRARKTHESLARRLPNGVDLRLVHSRFRPYERQGWRNEFLCKDACTPDADRIIVATQVVEAGVDVSASVLVTELAPWPSLVQRFGRAARWGGAAEVVVLTQDVEDDEKARPYTKAELDAARDLALPRLASVSQAHLEEFESSLNEKERGILYPYSPQHLLLRHEWDELFDTTPDLTGADVDISRFIRSGDERDLRVFWHAVESGGKPADSIRPAHAELCPVPFLAARDWLCGPEKKQRRNPRLRKGMHAWVWDWLDGRWKRAQRRDLYPGQTVQVAASCGGYSPEFGWDPNAAGPVPAALREAPTSPYAAADERQDDESLSAHPWKTIATHGREAGELARTLAARLAPRHTQILELAGRWHDVGKAHDCFQGSIRRDDRPTRQDLAKAPNDAWPRPHLYEAADSGDRRCGLRHELASTLALFAVLQRRDPDHPALLGPWRGLLANLGGLATGPVPDSTPSPLESEVLALGADDFDLLAYLVCSHHGKVRVTWHSCPADQEYRDTDGRGQPIRGVRQGDRLPEVALCSASGDTATLLPASTLDLAPAAAGLSFRTGRSWTERTLDLVGRHGPARLAWLEALLRAADIRASRLNTPDPLLQEGRK